MKQSSNTLINIVIQVADLTNEWTLGMANFSNRVGD